MGSLENWISRLEGRIEPGVQDEGAELRRKQIIERLDELARILRREGEAINNRTAALEEQGYSRKDAQTVAKDEVVRSKSPELAAFLDESFPPEIRHDPVAKMNWLTNYIESRKRG